MAPHLYFSINQLKELICHFPPDGSCGYLRIQIIMSVFSHIVDLENMHLIFDHLFHRVGIMNILDPLKPERMYRLDLRRHDHREYAKILAYLAVYEAVPGWTLPSTWLRADDGGINGGKAAMEHLCRQLLGS
eukprot:gene22435-30689_t